VSAGSDPAVAFPSLWDATHSIGTDDSPELCVRYAEGEPRGTGRLFEFMRFLLLAPENRILVNFPVLAVPQNKGGRHSRGKCYMHTFTPIIQNTAGRSN